MSSPPPPPSLHTRHRAVTRQQEQQWQGAAPRISKMMPTEADHRPAWQTALHPPHLLANLYTRLPPPAILPQPPKPPLQSLQLDHSSIQSHHPPASHYLRPQPIFAAAPRLSIMSINQIISHEVSTTAGTKRPHSPHCDPQILPRTVCRPTPTFKRTYGFSQQLEDRAMYVDMLDHDCAPLTHIEATIMPLCYRHQATP